MIWKLDVAVPQSFRITPVLELNGGEQLPTRRREFPHQSARETLELLSGIKLLLSEDIWKVYENDSYAEGVWPNLGDPCI